MADGKEQEKREQEPQEQTESAAARRIRGLGLDKETEPPIEVEKVGFWENFWYHYKTPTILISIAVFVLVVCVWQLAGKESPDIYVMYAGPAYLTAGEVQSVKSAFRSVMEDYNGDGELGIMITDINYLSQEQIAEKEALAEEQGVDLIIDHSGNASEYERFELEIIAGESVILLLDPALYENVRKAGGLIPLTDLLGELPACAIDEWGIRFADTPFAQYFTAMSVFPEDTVLCVRTVSSMAAFKGKKKTEQLHENHVNMFGNLLTFE